MGTHNSLQLADVDRLTVVAAAGCTSGANTTCSRRGANTRTDAKSCGHSIADGRADATTLQLKHILLENLVPLVGLLRQGLPVNANLVDGWDPEMRAALQSRVGCQVKMVRVHLDEQLNVDLQIFGDVGHNF